MSWDNDDMQDLIAAAQRAEMLRQQDKQLEELKKQTKALSGSASTPKERELKCPACAEWIKAEAKICKFCRTEVEATFKAFLAEEQLKKQEEEEEKRRIFEKQRQAEQDKAKKLRETREREHEEWIKQREEQKRKFKETIKSKKGRVRISLAVLALLSIGFSIYTLKANQEAQALEEQKNLNLTEVYTPLVCDAFESILNQLTLRESSSTQLKSANGTLSNHLKHWAARKTMDNPLYAKMSSFSQIIGKIGDPRLASQSQELKAFEEKNFEHLIEDSCGIGSFVTYNSELVYWIEYWSTKPKNLKVQLQKKTLNGEWKVLSSQDPKPNSDGLWGGDFRYKSPGLQRADSWPNGSYRTVLDYGWKKETSCEWIPEAPWDFFEDAKICESN